MAETSIAASSPPDYVARLHTRIETVRETWHACETQGLCTAFQRYDWTSAIVQHLLPAMHSDFFVIEVLDGTSLTPLMLLPLLRRRYPGYAEIEWFGLGVCDYSAPLLTKPVVFSKGQAEAAWRAVLAVLPRTDRLTISGLPEEIAPGIANPLALLDAAGTMPEIFTSGLAISAPPETLIARVCKRSFAKRYEKDKRRLERIGTVSLEEATTPEEVEAMFSELVRLRIERFQKLGRFDLLSRPSYVDYYRDCAHQGLVDGAVRILGLRIDGEWLAVLYMLVHGGSSNGIIVAIDETREHNVSPGLLMIAKAMEWACVHDISYFDLSIGSHGYKQHMGAQSYPLFQLDEVFTLKGRLVAVVAEAMTSLKNWLRKQPKVFSFLQATRARLRQLKASLSRGSTR